ncbi:hypothetical protein CYMTET_15727 [Cymbomonas tetramitiformis]|uniref:Uncharacterized protein n=1 Tax=Cymbomonas tetramitiformis TaxID=36881 RepID=A0AAE0GDW1_9CHLO|nr:hypothetical protein CYMTET_15727 [Cymbomonas tetramitiformis]
MSIQLGFNEPEQQGYWRPVPVFPPPPGMEGPPPSPDYSPGPTDDEAEASGTADFDNEFNLDSAKAFNISWTRKMPAPPTNSIEIEKTLTTFRRGVRRFFHPKTGSAPRYTKST